MLLTSSTVCLVKCEPSVVDHFLSWGFVQVTHHSILAHHCSVLKGTDPLSLMPCRDSVSH